MKNASKSFSVRYADDCDVSFVADAEKRYIDCPWTVEQIREEIHNPDALFLVLEADGAPIGYISGTIGAGECEVSNIAVDCEYRRKGCGGLLMKEFLNGVKSRNAETVFLLVRVDNTPAIGLYGKYGFEVVGERPRYYKGKDALIMRLNL